MGKLLFAAVAACVIGCATAKDRVVVVPAHPDDLIPCFGTCLLSKDIFEWHAFNVAVQRERGRLHVVCPAASGILQDDFSGTSAAEDRCTAAFPGCQALSSN